MHIHNISFWCIHLLVNSEYLGFWPEYAEPIPTEEVRLWSQWYLEGKASILGLVETSVSQYDVDKYMMQVEIIGDVSL